MSDQQAYFNSRIKRIKDPKNLSYRDPELGINIPKRLSKKVIKVAQKDMTSRVSRMQMLSSLFLGVACVMAARYLRFHIVGIEDLQANAQVLMAIDIGIAAILAFVVGAVIKHTKLPHMAFQVAGIGMMLVSMHNLVWLLPEETALIYSDAYVQQVQSLTTPQSIYFNGATIAAL